MRCCEGSGHDGFMETDHYKKFNEDVSKVFFTILYDSRSIQHDQHIQDWIMMLLWDSKVTQEDQQCECNEGLDHDASLMTP